jgi:hypothetical protein
MAQVSVSLPQTPKACRQLQQLDADFDFAHQAIAGGKSLGKAAMTGASEGITYNEQLNPFINEYV